MHPQLAHPSTASAPSPLRLDGVSFRYDSRPEQPVLTDVSLTVPPGRTVGLIGENVNWYGSVDHAMTTIIIADVWKTTPFMALLLLAGLQTIPASLTEAARMDGATIGRELIYVLTPMAVPGLASTLLLNLILAWNEAFWTLNLSTLEAAPLTVFIASYSSPEG